MYNRHTYLEVQYMLLNISSKHFLTTTFCMYDIINFVQIFNFGHHLFPICGMQTPELMVIILMGKLRTYV